MPDNTLFKTNVAKQAVKKPGSKRQQGFTLLEVLVAGFILFLVISAMTMIYRGAMLSSSKAERAVQISKSLPFILDKIRVTIRQHPDKTSQRQSQQGQLFNTDYHWTAQMVELTAPPQRFDADQLQFVTYDPRFKLWQVNLTVQIDQVKRTFEYRETSW